MNATEKNTRILKVKKASHTTNQNIYTFYCIKVVNKHH